MNYSQFFALSFLAYWLIGCQAATAQQSLKRQATPYALEITYPDKPSEYIPVPPMTSSLHASPLPTAPAQGYGPITLDCRLEEQGVRIELIASSGSNSSYRSGVFASFVLREGEKTVVPQAANVGFKPFQIRVVKVKPFELGDLAVENKMKSLEVVKVEKGDTTYPSYTLTLRNTSSKNIVKFSLEVLRENGMWFYGTGGVGQGGHPLLKPGETYTLRTTNAPVGTDTEANGRMTPEGVEFTLLPKVALTAVVFDDGSYEGRRMVADEWKALKHGQQLQLEPVNTQLRDLASLPAFTMADLAYLKSTAERLNEDVDEGLVLDLTNQLIILVPQPMTKEARILQLLKSGKFDIKRALLEEIKKAEHIKEAVNEPPLLQKWLTNLKQQFEEWQIGNERQIR